MAEDTGAAAATVTETTGADAGAAAGEGAQQGSENQGAAAGAQADKAAAPPPKQDTRQGPLNRRDARKGLSAEVATRIPQDATSDVTKAPAASDAAKDSATTEAAAGTDTRQSGAPADAADASKTGAAADASKDGAAKPAEPPARIRIDLPEGHALRGSGRTFVTAADETEARIIRAGLNSHARLGELNTLRGQNRQLQEELARRDAATAAREKWESDPKSQAIQARAQELRDAYGDEVADTFLRGNKATLADLEKKEIDARMAAINDSETEQAGMAWKVQKFGEMSAVMPEPVADHREFRGWFDEAVQTFDAKVAMGHYPTLTRENVDATFLAFFQGELAKNPKVKAVMDEVQGRKAREAADAAARTAAEKAREEEIARKAVEEFKRTAAESRRQAPPHPLGNLGQGTGSRVPAQEGDAAQGDKALDALSPQEIKRRARAGAISDARATVGA